MANAKAEEALTQGRNYIITKRAGGRFRIKNVTSMTKDGSGYHFACADGTRPEYGDGELVSAVPEDAEEAI